ncbi:MAG: 50S ribosomal protein L23 [Alphaproteobacteria bacterium]|nr:50S ribosomal protein L23 [Alphaproteobacteria bacterium]
MKLNDYDVIRRAIVTEKSQNCSANGQYFFEVLLSSNKNDIKRAVSQVFNVKVKTVNTLVRKGKTRRFKGREGVLKDRKIAIVTLEAGQVIELGLGV